MQKQNIKLKIHIVSFIKSLCPNWFFAATGTILGSIYFILNNGSILVAAIACLFLSTACFTNLSHRKTEIFSLLTAILLVFFNYNARSEMVEYQNIENALNKKDSYLKVVKVPKDMFFRSNLIVELRFKKPSLGKRLNYFLMPVRFLAHSSSSKAITEGDIVRFDSEIQLEKISARKIQFYKKDKVFYEIKKPDLIFVKTARSPISRIQEKISIYYHSTLSKTNAEIVTGLLFGSRLSNIPQDFISRIRNLGLGHFFAASGFHLLVLTLVLTWILKLIRIKEEQTPFILIPVTILYAGLAGFSPSIIRAAVFIITFLVLKLLKRKVWSIKFLLYLAGLILFIDPYTIFDIGFQLSYLATLALMLWANKVKESLQVFKIPDYILDILSVTISVQILLLPIIIYYFNSLQIWSMLANLIFTPVLSLIIIFSFFGLSFLLEPLLNLTKYLVEMSDRLPFINSHLEINITTAVLLLIFFNTLALIIFTKHGNREPKLSISNKLDANTKEFFDSCFGNSYVLYSILIGSIFLITANNLDPIGMQRIVFEKGLVANKTIPALKTKKVYEHFELAGKKALIIRDRSSLKKLDPLLEKITEVDFLFLPNLTAKDIYLDRLVTLLNPQFTIISYSERSKNIKVQENLREIGQRSNTIVNSGLIYISKDKFWSLKK